MTYRLFLKCNDALGAGKGVFRAVRLERIHSDWPTLELVGPPLHLRISSLGRMAMGDLELGYLSRPSWCGGIGWDSYWVSAAAAVRVVEFLRERGYGCLRGDPSALANWLELQSRLPPDQA